MKDKLERIKEYDKYLARTKKKHVIIHDDKIIGMQGDGKIWVQGTRKVFSPAKPFKMLLKKIRRKDGIVQKYRVRANK